MGGRGAASSWADSNYYEILGVDFSATADEIKQAFKRKALETHPDKNPGGEALFKKVAEAYCVLGNEEGRHKFDSRFLHRSSVTSSLSSDRSDGTLRQDGGAVRPARRVDFDEVYRFDHEMASKKGGFMKDFSVWRAQAETQKDEVMQACELRVREQQSAMEAMQTREAAVKQKKLDEIAKDVLQDWQEEMRRWEEQREEERKREKAEADRKAREIAEASLKEVHAKEGVTDELLEKARRARQQARQEKEREFIPTLAELDIRSDEELARLETILQSRLNYIQELRVQRQRCIACHERPRQGLVYGCGHGPMTCLECAPVLRHCPKCHSPINEPG